MNDSRTLNISLRPKNFDEVIGLEEQIATIKSKIDSGALPPAWILSGPFGCGKSTLSYIIARAVQGWDFAADLKPDVEEINAADMTGVDDMRALIKRAVYLPYVGRFRVIILDEAHKLSKAAQEPLLKEFEKPNSPTIWIIATTDPDKLIEGIRAGRCFTVKVTPMDEQQRRALIERAAKHVEFTGDIESFLAEIKRAQVVSPRKILMAFDQYISGMPLAQAIGAMSADVPPEFHEIAFAVAFGQWDKDSVIAWMGGKTIKAVGTLLRELDDKLKKKPKPGPDTEESESALDDEDLQGKPEVARALRGIVGAFLKGMLLPKAAKGKYNFKAADKMQRAYEAMHILANVVPPGNYELEWSGTIAALYRVNQKLNGK